MTWHPTATFNSLKKRAQIVQQIRDFFIKRNVLEVDTPLLFPATVTDPHVIGIPAYYKPHGNRPQTLFLQTSPEYAMKRLLAAGYGSIFQLCKAFRQGDFGKIHNPEFTMLEWYRLGFNHHDLMNEMDELLQSILQTPPAERLTYQQLFENYLGINPHTASHAELIQCAKAHPIQFVPPHNQTTSHATEQTLWLNLLLTHCIEPQIGQEKPVFIYDFPVTQAALAKIRDDEEPRVASRFEVYFKGIELANGFHELQDATEQRRRFDGDNVWRSENNMTTVAIDEDFLAALEAGLPNCSGVALGVDRLIMLALNANSIHDVMSFGFA